jgi:hypothetical protein
VTKAERAGDPASTTSPAIGVLAGSQTWTGRWHTVNRPSVSRGCELVLDLAVVVLATWTVVYHVCLLSRLDAAWAVGLEAIALAVAGVVWHRAAGRSEENVTRGRHVATWKLGPSPTESSSLEVVLRYTTVICAAVAALLLAVHIAWTAVAAFWLVAAGAGTYWAVLRIREPAQPAQPVPLTGERTESAKSAGVLVALAWATALAVLSTFTLWPNPDDLYYVNLSQWVVEHGTFPLRDTIFSDLVFPMSSWPPMASYDAMVGALARLGGLQAGTVAYILVPPVATFLSVLALWRLLHAWRVQAIGMALSLALIFLLLDGGSGYAAPGNLFLIRIWQGKVILLCLMVPILLVYALRYVERPTRVRAGWLFAGGVASVGLSTTAMFLVPLLAVGGAAPLFLRRPRQALLGFVAMAAYPLATGAVTIAVHGRSADLFGTRALYRFSPAWFGHEIFRDGPLALIAVSAVLVGALLVPHPAARVTTGVCAVITGVTFVPRVTHLSFDLVGLGPTLWRVSWIVSIAALVGVLGAWVSSRMTRRSVRLGAPFALVAVLAVFGMPIWSGGNGVSLELPPHWQRGSQSVDSAQLAIAAARPGDVILAPEELAVTIDVITTRVKTVAPRDYFMDYLKDDPSFHYEARQRLVDFANLVIGRVETPAVARALTLLDVDEVCLPVGSHDRFRFLRAQGYRTAARSDSNRCFTR